MSPRVSIILPTHNPHRGRLARTLAGLRAQTLAASEWEIVLIDNASSPLLSPDDLDDTPANLRIVPEPQLGLTAARRRGVAESRGEFIVFVDDDNVLAPDYLAQTVAFFDAHPRVGALGGPVVPEFEAPRPTWWHPEFESLLACRHLGAETQIATALFDPRTGRNEYPLCAPVGAGMALRRAALDAWLADATAAALPDRQGASLSSSGDNDIVLWVIRSGWHVGYAPSLVLSHLIPAGRLDAGYLARLNHGIARSWVQVLHKHDANPWPPIPAWSVPLRKLKAWFVYRAWSGPVARIRWQGACGHFEGRAALPPPAR